MMGIRYIYMKKSIFDRKHLKFWKILLLCENNLSGLDSFSYAIYIGEGGQNSVL